MAAGGVQETARAVAVLSGAVQNNSHVTMWSFFICTT